MPDIDLETCSLCLVEVPFKSLREVTKGNPHIYIEALICRVCRTTHNIPTRKV